MLTIKINGEIRTVSEPVTLADLISKLGYDCRRIAVEVNREVVPLPLHGQHRLAAGDDVEIVTLVGGGAPEVARDRPLRVGSFTFHSRLITGTGKYVSYELMRECL